jgi:23S rRNA pseudouridine1911/1915/1917 synthase
LIISTPPDPDLFDAQESDEPEDTPQIRELQITSALHGQRLDRVLADGVQECSRSYLQQLIAAGAVQLNGAAVDKASIKVAVGQVLRVEIRPTQQSQAFKPEDMCLDVVYEDDALLVINKPAGLVVHPAAGNWSGTLLNGLLARSPAHMQLPRAGIVHRLDKDTSGLMVVARTRQSMDRLIEMIAARQVRRQYLALAHHDWKRATQVTVDKPIGRDPRNRLRMAVVNLEQQSGKTARTHFTCLQTGGQYCWVQALLDTGRTHQIRVHLSEMGHPLVADGLYGGKPTLGMARQALHAQSLELPHPVTGLPLAFQAPLPADMAAALLNLGWATMADT